MTAANRSGAPRQESAANETTDNKSVAPPTYAIETFDNFYAPIPEDSHDPEWRLLVDYINFATKEVFASKAKLPLWGPFKLRTHTCAKYPKTIEHKHRCTECVEYVSLIVLDIEHVGDEEQLEHVGRIRDLGLAVIIYESASDRTKTLDDGRVERRWRTIVQPSRPITVEESARVRCACARLLGLDPDAHGVKEAKDAAHQFYIGTVEGTEEREVAIFDGGPLDVDMLLAGEFAAPATVKPTASSNGAPSANDARMARARALAQRLEPSVMGHGGDEALFKCARELATVLGPNADAIELALTDTFNPRCLPPWPESKLKREADGAAEHRAKLDNDPIRKAEARRAAEQNQHDGPQAEPIDTTTPILVQLRKSPPAYFVLDPRTATPTYVECGKHSLHRTIDELASSYIATTYKGRLIPIADILTEHAPTVGGVEWDFSAPGGLVYVRERDRMVGGVACPVIEPEFDLDVEAWLRAMARDEARLAALKEWITSTRQDAIRRLATCLLVIGPHTIGKTLLAIVSARLWGASSPVPLNHVVKQFNASMTRTPIVLDDEAKTLARREITTEEFRTLIQNREREYEPKGQEMRMLRGAQRFVVTANDVSAFTFANGAGVGAVDAIAERLLQIVVPKEEGDHVRGLLDKLRRDDGEIDFDRMVGHFEHIRQTTELPDASVRFLGADPDKQAAQTAVVASIVQEFELVFEMVATLLTEGTSIGGMNRDNGETVVLPALFMSHGAVWARPAHLAEYWALLHPRGPYLSVKDAQKALAPFRGPRESVKFKGKSLRAWELDASRLVQALVLDLAVVQRNLARSSQK